MSPPTGHGEQVFRGIAVSTGVVHAKLHVLGGVQLSVERRNISAALAPQEISRLEQALVSTRVRFAPLGPGEIEAYVATGEPLACAGGFALEGRGGMVVERLEGCWSNVIGLSLPLLRRWLG